MERNKEEEAKALKDKEELDNLIEKRKGDRCPHCAQLVDSFPYMSIDSFGRVECVSCGVVFVPKSLRDIKVAKAQQKIQEPGGRLYVPGR